MSMRQALRVQILKDHERKQTPRGTSLTSQVQTHLLCYLVRTSTLQARGVCTTPQGGLVSGQKELTYWELFELQADHFRPMPPRHSTKLAVPEAAFQAILTELWLSNRCGSPIARSPLSGVCFIYS